MSTAIDVVDRQIQRGGAIWLNGLATITEEDFFEENPDGLSAAWATGHAAAVLALFASWFDEEDVLFDPSFHQLFNDTALVFDGPSNAKRTAAESRYTKDDLLFRFREATIRALRVLRRFDLGLWDEPAPPGLPESLPTCGSVWEKLATHAFWHLGALAGSMPVFKDQHSLNPVTHYFYDPEGE